MVCKYGELTQPHGQPYPFTFCGPPSRSVVVIPPDILHCGVGDGVRVLVGGGVLDGVRVIVGVGVIDGVSVIDGVNVMVGVLDGVNVEVGVGVKLFTVLISGGQSPTPGMLNIRLIVNWPVKAEALKVVDQTAFVELPVRAPLVEVGGRAIFVFKAEVVVDASDLSGFGSSYLIPLKVLKS